MWKSCTLSFTLTSSVLFHLQFSASSHSVLANQMQLTVFFVKLQHTVLLLLLVWFSWYHRKPQHLVRLSVSVGKTEIINDSYSFIVISSLASWLLTVHEMEVIRAKGVVLDTHNDFFLWHYYTITSHQLLILSCFKWLSWVPVSITDWKSLCILDFGRFLNHQRLFPLPPNCSRAGSRQKMLYMIKMTNKISF